MKKRIGALLVAGVMACSATVTLALAGCNSAAKPEFEMPEGGFDTETPVTITFYHTMGAKLRNILDYYIEDFNKLYPNIKVEHFTQGDYDGLRKQIDNEIVAGNQPSIAYCYPDHVALYNNAAAVQSLNDFLPDGAYADYKITRQDGVEVSLGLTQPEYEMYNPNYFAEGYKFDDETKLYTLPWIKSTEVMYYNQTFFEQNGLEVPTTWDELEQFCIKVKEMDKTKYPFTYDSEANWFITMCEQYGSEYTSSTGKKFRFDNETNRAFVARFADWYQKGYFTTEVLNGNTYTSGLFTEGSSYMCIGSSGGASYQTDTSSDLGAPFKVGIAQIPQVDPVNNPKVISQGPSVCIFKSEDPQEVLASWLFAKYFTTNIDFQAEFSSVSGYMPVLKPEVMATNETYTKFLEKSDDPNFLTALSVKVGMEHSNSYFVSPAFVGSSEARTEVGALMTAVFGEPDSLDAAFKAALSRCEYNFG